MTYDKIDKKILSALRIDSQGKLHELSKLSGVPKSTLHERLHKLCDNGVRCTPVMDWTKLGYPLSVLFFVPFDERILEHAAINSAQRVTPNLLLLECIFANMKDVEEFKEHLQAARYFAVVDVLKREGFVPS